LSLGGSAIEGYSQTCCLCTCDKDVSWPPEPGAVTSVVLCFAPNAKPDCDEYCSELGYDDGYDESLLESPSGTLPEVECCTCSLN
jgi:hypothetical protein